eukprot:Plantae.Rhodophyta-Purpureofilum_apyrenoidigerum.ctg12547.p1 GENE.Plantae.Rhodophyta-Purpureofilum_apyrenoidigerum.ctg12547~~Plantae.Rhodophyta-Purpureofilum_apyrenoidigerum.ctg12547.p1  ORF type:complete len:534 (+),score=110.94 Plantae.Rhodophyta-Purpureofilum_apyrenoidigerum.ctg12547:136-1737(+)
MVCRVQLSYPRLIVASRRAWSLYQQRRWLTSSRGGSDDDSDCGSSSKKRLDSGKVYNESLGKYQETYPTSPSAENYLSSAQFQEFKNLAKRLRSCAKQGDFVGTMAVLRMIDERGYERNSHINLHLMEVFGANNRWRDALKIFNGTENPTKHHFSYILSLLGKMGRVEEALGIYHKAKRMRILMSVVMYNALLLAFAKTADEASANKVLQQMSEDGVRPTESTYNTMINLYARKKDSAGARRFFDKMVAENIPITTVTFNALLYAFVNAGELDEALKMFEQMVDHKPLAAEVAANEIGRLEAIVGAIVQSKQIRPTIQTFATMITAFARAQQLDNANALFARLKRSGIPLNTVVYNAMIDAHVRIQKLEDAHYLLGEMRVQGIRANTFSYTTLMFGFAKARKHSAVEELFEEMRRYGISMNAAPYNALALAHIFAREYQRAREVLVTMAVDPDHFTLGLRKSAGLEGESEQIIALANANLHEQVAEVFQSTNSAGIVLSERAVAFATRSLIILQEPNSDNREVSTSEDKQKTK